MLRIVENLADVAGRPSADPVAAAFSNDRVWWRVAVGVAVEAVGDGLVADSIQCPEEEDSGDHRPAYGIRDQAVLSPTLLGLVLDRVPRLDGRVAVRRFADVEALVGVGFSAAPGQLKHVQHVPLGDGLLDAPGQGGCGPAEWRGAFVEPRHCGWVDALVGGQQSDAGLLELVLDLRAEVRGPCHPLDRLADHRNESPIRTLRLGEQVRDPAVAGDGNVELLVRGAGAAAFDALAAGLDVVELRHDDESGWQRVARALQLAGEGEGGILRVVGRGAAHPGDGHRRLLESLGNVLVGNDTKPVQQGRLVTSVDGLRYLRRLCGHVVLRLSRRVGGWRTTRARP
ncbi:hypothetical protein ODJ79_38355 [Actinoplanes sp. KI2]|nr:hypothetical protein [Actinoplanes sp. KI2]MCU7729614.1 hypothetical protein [Actinoplanes sp. KI2]